MNKGGIIFPRAFGAGPLLAAVVLAALLWLAAEGAGTPGGRPAPNVGPAQALAQQPAPVQLPPVDRTRGSGTSEGQPSQSPEVDSLELLVGPNEARRLWTIRLNHLRERQADAGEVSEALASLVEAEPNHPLAGDREAGILVLKLQAAAYQAEIDRLNELLR